MNSGRVNIAAAATLQLGGSFTLWADDQIGNGGALSVVNAGSLLDFGGHSESVGALSITGNAAVAVGATGTASKLGTAVVRATSLTITTGGKLDLANNRLIVDYGGDSPITSIRTALSTGYAGGAWNGPGIESSTAVANPTRALAYAEANDILSSSGGTFAGQNVDGTAVLIGYTLAGDTNLDGAVDFSDLVRLAQNYNVTDGTRVWANGDFNYDGSVDFADLVKLAQNYNSALPGEPIADAPTGFEAELARAFASGPEPNVLTVVAFGSLLMKRRRP
jgi:hypothetical protein